MTLIQQIGATVAGIATILAAVWALIWIVAFFRGLMNIGER